MGLPASSSGCPLQPDSDSPEVTDKPESRPAAAAGGPQPEAGRRERRRFQGSSVAQARRLQGFKPRLAPSLLTPAAASETLGPLLLGWVLVKGCLVQVGNDIELDTVGRQFEPYRWRPCGVTWDAVPEQSW